MKDKIEKLIAKVCKKWDFYKGKEEVIDKVSYPEKTSVKTLFGDQTAWNNPELLWVFVNIEDGGWDGSGIQVGISKDGKIYWQYQSHCSCNDFGDSIGHDGELCLGCDEKPKSYELNSIPDNWEEVVYGNLETILKVK
jgi:hypothetical protein